MRLESGARAAAGPAKDEMLMMSTFVFSNEQSYEKNEYNGRMMMSRKKFQFSCPLTK